AHMRFFFTSRRRHTRSKRDWSSDVCSSDLYVKSLAACPNPKQLRYLSTSCVKRLVSSFVHLKQLLVVKPWSSMLLYVSIFGVMRTLKKQVTQVVTVLVASTLKIIRLHRSKRL